MDEFRLALRRLTARPAATTASIVTLACAIGAAAAAWSLMSAVLLRPLPVRDPDRLMVVGYSLQYGPAAGSFWDGATYPLYPAIRDSGIFEDVTAHWGTPLRLPVDAGAGASPTFVGFVSRNFFSLLGVPIPLGRAFRADEDRRGAAPAAILTDAAWHHLFAANPGIIGRTIDVAGKKTTIVGVLPRGFRGVHLGDAPDLFLPLQTIDEVGSPSMNFFAEPNHISSPTAGLAIIGRLRPGESREQALARVRSVSRFTGSFPTHPDLTDIDTAALPPMARHGLRQFTLLLGGTVGLLLLIGCTAVGVLLLIRTEARREEFAMCLALGASRRRLVRGIGLEGLLLAIAGAAAALPVALWLMSGIRAFQLPGGVDIALLDLSIDRRVLFVTAAAAVGATLLMTLIAGLFGFSANLADALRSRGGSTARATRRRTRTILVASQVALALVLLVGAGLFARSVMAALTLNSGLDAAHLLTADVSFDDSGQSSIASRAFFADLRARLDREPSLASVSYSLDLGGMADHLIVDGVPLHLSSTVWSQAVDARYFRTVRLPVIEGRGFSADDRAGAPHVALVSESFARLVGHGGSALGHRVTRPFHEEGRPADVKRIVGVVPDVVERVSVLAPLAMYFPIAQTGLEPSRIVTARASGDVEAARRAIATTISHMNPALTPSSVLTIEERIGRQMSAQQFGIVVLGALAAIAVLLTALGTYVLAESMAALRLREMGIRAALGATRAQLGAIVLRESARLVGTGVLCGIGVAWLSADAIRSFLFQVQPLDPLTIAAAAGSIMVVAVLVSLRPALRAARVDLVHVLRND
ncbi:MAG TPA: ABC transporter permease [Vicinamibacterales bacterium]|nr:ABC transporter permease [Vicinamibacterales bacterium]